MKRAEITGAQIKKIHALKGALCLDDAVYRELLFNTFRAGSCKELNYYQAERLIKDMEGKAVDSGVWERRGEPKKYEEWGHRRGCMATPAQLRKIESTWGEIDTQAYAKKKELDEESKAVEGVLRQLFISVSDLDGNNLAENINRFRELLVRVDREYLVEEYLQLEADCMPSVPAMEKAEFKDILEEVKKSPDSILNSSNIPTLRRLLRFLESQRQS